MQEEKKRWSWKDAIVDPGVNVETCSHPTLDEEGKQVPCGDQAKHCYHYYAAISHYRKVGESWERSFIQVYGDENACSHGHQVGLGHKRIDALRELEHGTFDVEKMHPTGGHPHLQNVEVNRARAEYHPNDGVLSHLLPSIDAITGETLSDSIYIPHVGDAHPTQHYQEVLQRAYPGYTVEQVTLGTATFDHAIELCHIILDEILHPAHLSWHRDNGTLYNSGFYGRR